MPFRLLDLVKFMNATQYDICVVGAGAVGIFSAIKLAHTGFKVGILENTNKVGGQLNLYLDKEIHNLFPLDGITSRDLIKKLTEKLNQQNSINLIKQVEIKDIQTKDNNFILTFSYSENQTSTISTIRCKYLILAYGKGKEEPNKLPLANAKPFENKNIFYEVKDKQCFKGKNIVIAGGSDSAIDWAIEISKIAKITTIVHRREINKPENPDFANFQNLITTGKILTKIPYAISNIATTENENFAGVEIKSTTGTQILNCDYLLAFYGIKSVVNNIEIYKSIGLDVDQELIKVDYRNNQTNIDNVYAIGDCCVFDGKIANIFMGFADAMKCIRDICKKEKNRFAMQNY